jgi:diketogulonate reductase-like aldo/keto reductase
MWALVLDTAQAYRNETEAGTAIRDSGLKREEIYVTTKYSGMDGMDVQTSIRNSLKNVGGGAMFVMLHSYLTLVVQLGLSYVDLYLIHHPRLAIPDIPTVWKEFEKIKADGLAKLVHFPAKSFVPH